MTVSGVPLSKVLLVKHKTEGVFEELKAVQRKFEYLPAEELKRIADRRGLALRDLHAIASYYPHFYLEPPAKVIVKVCDHMTCHLRGAPALLQKLAQRLQDMAQHELTIPNVPCAGPCHPPPPLIFNDRPSH